MKPQICITFWKLLWTWTCKKSFKNEKIFSSVKRHNVWCTIWIDTIIWFLYYIHVIRTYLSMNFHSRTTCLKTNTIAHIQLGAKLILIINCLATNAWAGHDFLTDLSHTLKPKSSLRGICLHPFNQQNNISNTLFLDWPYPIWCTGCLLKKSLPLALLNTLFIRDISFLLAPHERVTHKF